MRGRGEVARGGGVATRCRRAGCAPLIARELATSLVHTPAPHRAVRRSPVLPLAVERAAARRQ